MTYGENTVTVTLKKGDGTGVAQDTVLFTVVKFELWQEVDTVRSEITNQLVDTCVGKKISLWVDWMPKTVEPDNYGWSVDGLTSSLSTTKVIKLYDANENSTTITPLQSTDLSESYLDYYWLTGGNPRPVHCSLQMKQINFSASCKFNVQRPNTTITVTTGPISTDAPDGCPPGMYTGDSNVPGIRLCPNVDFMSSFPGSAVCWFQVANLYSFGSRLNNVWTYKNVSNAFDNTGNFPYPFNPDTSKDTEDSPGVSWPSQGDGECMTFNFSTYLMFKPGGTDSIWVPLRQVAWYASAQAYLSGLEWNITTQSGVSALQDDCTILPEWTSSFTSNF